MGGYVWTGSQSATYNQTSGDLDIKDSGYWGVAVDFYAVPYMQVRLLYRRQDSQLTFKRAGTGITEDIDNMSVEYLHIGVVKGIQKGKVLPFSTATLGATRFASDSFEDSWKFSVIFGLGAKIHLSDKIGIMAAGHIPISITDGFVGVSTGGLSLGGYGITQIDVTGGLVITL